MTDTPEAVPPLVYWANSLTISMDEHTRRVNEVRSDAILQVQKIGADYQRLMDKHNALHINALASRQRVAELEAEVQEQARLNGMGAERELALMAQVSRLEAERDQLRAELEKVPTQLGYASMMGCEIFAGIFDDAIRPINNAVVIEFESIDELNSFLRWHYSLTPPPPTPPNADQKGQ